jgi:hypothetical protein
MEANGISEKFNTNAVPLNVIPISSNEKISESKLESLLESQITNDIAKIWFPWDNVKKSYSMETIYERGLLSATYGEVATAEASSRQKALLMDAGEKLIDRSYILVWDIRNIRATSARATKGYMADVDVYLYRLDWTSLLDKMWTQWDNPKAIEQMSFTVSHIASFVEKSLLTDIEVKYPKSADDDAMLNGLASEIVKKADAYLTEANPDFKVGATVFATSPVRARIGTKEGVTIDQRYFVYEYVLNKRGELMRKRRGAVRAKKVAVNTGIASKENPLSRFYQISGRKIRDGMLLEQKPDHGIGISVYGSPVDINVQVDFGLSVWAGKYASGTSFSNGTKAYIKYKTPLEDINSEIVHVDGTTEKIRSFGLLGAGLSKDLCFFHRFALTPYVGYTGLLVSKKLQSGIDNMEKLTFGIEAGVVLSIALSPILSITGNAGYNSVMKSWYSEKYLLGGGLKIQF